MAPRRKRTTPLGDALRAAREALGFDQRTLAARLRTTTRQISRWENGQRPTLAAAPRILEAVEEVPDPLYDALAAALGYEVESADSPAPPAPPPAAPAHLRAAFDAIIFAASEQRDVLPRHLRAFGIELLQGADRLGLTAKEAAALVAVPEHAKGNDTLG